MEAAITLIIMAILFVGGTSLGLELRRDAIYRDLVICRDNNLTYDKCAEMHSWDLKR